MTVVLPTCFFRHDLAMRLARPTEIFSNVANTSRDSKSTIHTVTRMVERPFHENCFTFVFFLVSLRV